MASDRPSMIAVGGVCVTGIFRVKEVPSLPAKVLADGMCRIADGMAVSAACAYVRLGGTAAVWGRVGDDDDGAFASGSLASAGLDVSSMRIVPGGRTSQATVVVDHTGRRLVVPFHDPGLDATTDWLPVGMIADVDIVHCDVRWPEAAEIALLAARRMGVPTMIDGDVAPPAILRRLVPLADYAIFSDAGLRALTGLSDVPAGLHSVADWHAGHVGATCGADGYTWIDEGTVRHVPSPRIEVVDTLAAGDVFHGAFALAIVEGRSVESAARFACTAAALKCARFGGRLGCPTRAEVDAMTAPSP